MNIDELKQIPNYPGYYASQDGNIYSQKTNKYLIGGRNHCGYRQVDVIIDGKRKNRRVHRLIALAYLPVIENHDEVNHIDGDKNNNSATNLEWSTRSKNIKHMWDMGKRNRAVNNSQNGV